MRALQPFDGLGFFSAKQPTAKKTKTTAKS
jgi:hypothetical protein